MQALYDIYFMAESLKSDSLLNIVVPLINNYRELIPAR